MQQYLYDADVDKYWDLSDFWYSIKKEQFYSSIKYHFPNFYPPANGI